MMLRLDIFMFSGMGVVSRIMFIILGCSVCVSWVVKVLGFFLCLVRI